jgi:large subunit ribosomal protein L21
MNIAVIKLAGKQYLVTPGSKFVASGIMGNAGDSVAIEEVLLFAQNEKLELRTPSLHDVKIEAKIVFAGKGDKIRVAKFKAKSRYRKVMGFRPQETTIEVVSVNGETSEKKVKTANAVEEKAEKKAPKTKKSESK